MVTPRNCYPSDNYSRFKLGKHLSDKLHITNALKKGNALLPLLFKSALQYAIRRVQVNHYGFK